MFMHAFYVPFLSKGSVSGSINVANNVTVTLEKNYNSKFQIFWAAFSQLLKHYPVPLFGHNHPLYHKSLVEITPWDSTI